MKLEKEIDQKWLLGNCTRTLSYMMLKLYTHEIVFQILAVFAFSLV